MEMPDHAAAAIAANADYHSNGQTMGTRWSISAVGALQMRNRQRHIAVCGPHAG